MKKTTGITNSGGLFACFTILQPKVAALRLKIGSILLLKMLCFEQKERRN